MTTTIEHAEKLEVQAVYIRAGGYTKAARYMNEAARRLRELDAQVADLELKLLTERGAKAWADVPNATAFVEELRGNKEST